MLKNNLLRKTYLFVEVGLLVVMLGLSSTPVAQAANITVNTLDDVVNPNDGQCSLREAVVATNNNAPSGSGGGECAAGDPFPLPDQITFSVAGSIEVEPNLGPLPDLTDGATIIDGWSAPGAGPGNPPTVILDGSQASNFDSGLILTSDDNEVRGLAIINFVQGSGISISGSAATNNWVYGNRIGVNAQGNAAASNGIGVAIDAGAQHNLIGTNGEGTDDLLEENVISGNAAAGVLISGVDTRINMVAGNKIGVDVSGNLAIPNLYGVWIFPDASTNTIGVSHNGIDSDKYERNIISGNHVDGIRIESSGNNVAGNYIGLVKE